MFAKRTNFEIRLKKLPRRNFKKGKSSTASSILNASSFNWNFLTVVSSGRVICHLHFIRPIFNCSCIIVLRQFYVFITQSLVIFRFKSNFYEAAYQAYEFIKRKKHIFTASILYCVLCKFWKQFSLPYFSSLSSKKPKQI